MTHSRHVHELTATELTAAMQQGQLALSDYLNAMHTFTQAVDPQVLAFAHYNQDIVKLQAEPLDALRASGMDLPPLYGVPIAVKDVIDTEVYPTEYGFAATLGRTPSQDAYLVHRLRAAGAIIWAKAHTTELAYLHPSVTRNPRVPGHTPGGSSSGSAAAVAAGLVPAAIGTQANASVIRPASFCGVYGYKPTRELICTTGVLRCTQSLDQIGVFARSCEDLALVAQTMIGAYPTAQGRTVFPMNLLGLCKQEPPLQPKLMFARTPFWDQMAPLAQEAFLELKDELSDCLTELELHASVANSVGWLKTVMEAEMSVNVEPLVGAAAGQLSPEIVGLMERGQKISASDYLHAFARMHAAADAFDEYFEHFDAILTPAALGPAPVGLDSTGSPVMSTIWNFAGLPCVSLPLLQTEDGQPIGVQLVGKRNDDGRLLRTARWLVQRLGQ